MCKLGTIRKLKKFSRCKAARKAVFCGAEEGGATMQETPSKQTIPMQTGIIGIKYTRLSLNISQGSQIEGPLTLSLNYQHL